MTDSPSRLLPTSGQIAVAAILASQHSKSHHREVCGWCMQSWPCPDRVRSDFVLLAASGATASEHLGDPVRAARYVVERHVQVSVPEPVCHECLRRWPCRISCWASDILNNHRPVGGTLEAE